MSPRQIDCLVAEHIFLEVPPEPLDVRESPEFGWREGKYYHTVPYYCEDEGYIAEILAQCYGSCEIYYTKPGGKVQVRILDDKHTYEASAVTIQMAVCLAALKSKGVVVHEPADATE